MARKVNTDDARNIISEALDLDPNEFDSNSQGGDNEDDTPPRREASDDQDDDGEQDTPDEDVDGDDDEGEEGLDEDASTEQQMVDELLGTKSKGKKGDKAEPKEPKEPEDTRVQPIMRPARYSFDKKGNVIDPKTGKLLARAGNEANLFKRGVQLESRLFKADRDMNTLRNGLRDAVDIARRLQAQRDAYKEADQGTKLGLLPTEVADALQIAAKMKSGKDGFVEAMRTILTRAASNGIDVTSIGVQNPGLDIKTLLGEFDKRLQPITSRLTEADKAAQARQEAQDRQNEAVRAAAEETTTFFEENPEAMQYAPVFERLLKNPMWARKGLDAIWANIRLYEATQGRQRGSNRSIPSGRRRPMDSQPMDRPAPVDMDFKQIINEVLDQHGVR